MNSIVWMGYFHLLALNLLSLAKCRNFPKIERMVTTKETIAHEAGNKDAWTCKCGNQSHLEGFYACDKVGNEMSPEVGLNWGGLYVCARCGRIIDQQTSEVVGKNPNFKRLE
jgi:hypothetical protein